MHSQLHGAWYTFPRLIYMWNGKKNFTYFFALLQRKASMQQVDFACGLISLLFHFFDTLFSLFSSCAERIQIRTNLKYNLHMVDYITHEVVWLAVGLWFIYIFIYVSLFWWRCCIAASKCDQTASAAATREKETIDEKSMRDWACGGWTRKIIKHYWSSRLLFAEASSSSFDIHSSKSFVRISAQILALADRSELPLLSSKTLNSLLYFAGNHNDALLQLVLVESLFSRFSTFLLQIFLQLSCTSLFFLLAVITREWWNLYSLRCFLTWAFLDLTSFFLLQRQRLLYANKDI